MGELPSVPSKDTELDLKKGKKSHVFKEQEIRLMVQREAKYENIFGMV